MDTVTKESTEEKLLRIMEQHQGAANAVTYKDLAWQAGVTRRTVRRALKRLIENDLVPIGSISDGALGGYFLITTDCERKRAVAELRGRIKSLASRIQALQAAPLCLLLLTLMGCAATPQHYNPLGGQPPAQMEHEPSCHEEEKAPDKET